MRQRLGQHFLKDEKVVLSILAAAELQNTDTVLEIGPGRGVLTVPLVERIGHLVAVELDNNLAHFMTKKFQDKPQIKIVHGDILKVALDDLFKPSPFPHGEEDYKVKIVGNLPYSITSPIFEKIMRWWHWDTGVFLIQKEVAERIQAGPDSKTFGILSLAVQLFAEAEIIVRVKPGAFSPPPKVDSAVLRLRRKSKPLVAERDISSFFDLAHGAFTHRRKTLANSLALFAGLPRPLVEKWLTPLQVDPGIRAENLALHDYARLAGPWSIFRRESNLTA